MWGAGLAVVTATAGITGFAAPALAGQGTQAGASPACQPAQLRITAPASIPGDPGAALGQESWNIVLRNRGDVSCSLRGWPGLSVRGPSGAAVRTKVADVRASNLSAVPDAEVNLRPGASAVVTVTAPERAAGCITRWSADVTLPGASQPARVAEPGGAGSVCAGGQAQVSPFYPKSELGSAIAAMQALPASPVYPTTTAAEPASASPRRCRRAWPRRRRRPARPHHAQPHHDRPGVRGHLGRVADGPAARGQAARAWSPRTFLTRRRRPAARSPLTCTRAAR